MDDEIIRRKKFVGYIRSVGGILPFRVIGEQGIGLVHSQWEFSSKNGPVHGQKWETCRWTLEHTLVLSVCRSQNVTNI